jgi:hypothetical protein
VAAYRDERDRESEGAAEQVPAAAPIALPLSLGPQALLGLQGSVGNAALSRAVASGSRTLSRLLTGNPQDVAPVPTGPNQTPGSVHAAPTIADAAGHGPPTAAGGQSVTGVAVRPKITSAAPLEAATVTEDQLYEQGAAPDPSAPVSTGLTTIREIRGTVAAPMIEESADTSLFIDPGPKADDVQQGGLGDCWDMATFIGIVNRDPNKIRSIMAPDGSGGASVTFFRRTVTAAPAPPAPAPGAPPPPPPPPVVSYTPEAVAVDNTLAFRRATAAPGAPAPAPGAREARGTLPDGTTYGFRLYGAQLRAAPRPLKSFWWAELVGDVLEVHRRDVYQMARWAPLLEKAHARFAQPYGQYGHSGQVANEGENTGAGSGYNLIEGGYPGYTLTMFYGAAGQFTVGGQADTDPTTWRPNMATTALLTANAAAFDRLLTLGGRGETAAPTDTTAPIVTARTWGDSAGHQAYFPRLHDAIVAARSNSDWSSRYTAQARRDINAVDTAITAWNNAIPDVTPTPAAGQPANAKTPRAQAVVTAAHTAAHDPSRNPALSSDRASLVTKALMDMLLVVKNMPVDSSVGSRSVYAGHEYSVLSVNITDTSGAPLPIHATPPAGRAALYPRVDVDSPTAVRIMNPHHRNEPDPTGTAAQTRGVFTVSLRRFFRLFNEVMSASVNTTAPPP